MNKPITPLASMEARLKATGVYRLAATDLVYLELCAYQSALSVLFEGVLELEREGFLSTAQDWGLAEAEWRYGLAADGLTAAERRRRVQAYAYSRTAGGLEAFTALLAAMGCTGNAVLDGERWCVYLETAPPSGQAKADGSRASECRGGADGPARSLGCAGCVGRKLGSLGGKKAGLGCL